MFAEFYSAGGIWMHPIVVWSLVAGAAVAVHAFRPAKDMTRLVVASMLMALGLGVLASLAGTIEAFTAIAAAPADRREELLRMSLAIAFNPLALAVFGVVLVGHFAVPVLWLTRARRESGAGEKRAQISAA